MNTVSKKKMRVIIRQWTPRKTPYVITQELISQFINNHYSQFQTVIYAGWARRHDVTGKRTIRFYVATGQTSSEARKRFKQSTDFGNEIWEITDTKTQLVDPV